MMLPAGGHLNCGLGNKVRLDRQGYIPPNNLVTAEEMDVTIAGMYNVIPQCIRYSCFCKHICYMSKLILS